MSHLPDALRPADPAAPYATTRSARSRFLALRGLRYHLLEWGDASQASPQRPPLIMMHGWADIGASFQFVVDALAAVEGFERHIIAPDWRGFGLSQAGGSDAYWFADYLGDLDALIDAVSPSAPIDLLGHSMGGNVVMSYAGARPARIRRLVNLEGFGMPRTRPEQAPKRLAQWLDDLKRPQAFKGFDSEADVARRLMTNNPRLRPEFAAWLAPHWAAIGSDGRWHVRCDPAHKRVNPMLYRVDEILATWAAIDAPVLWAEGELTDIGVWWGERFTKAEFHERLQVVRQVQCQVLPDCGHMLHHDRPRAVAEALAHFLQA
jgi:pimeloyl-ACP methyl ester carboxylesterase